MLRPELLETLRVRGYRWLLLQNFGNSVGWTAEAIATGWLVLQLTDSPFWLGLIAGIRGLTQIVFSVVGGAVADRMELRGFLMRNQRYNFLLFLGVGVLVLSGRIEMWHLVLVQVVAGFLQAMNGPANQVIVYETVGPSRLLSARALGFLVMSVTRILSALVGGSIIAAFGTGPAYLFVCAGYLLGSVALLPLEPLAIQRHTVAAARSLLEGLKYSMRTKRVREVLLLSFATETFGFSHMQMVPVMARDVLQVGAVGLGYLIAASGAGQLAAMLLLANSGDVRRKDLLLLGSTFTYGVAIFGFALSPWFVMALLLEMVIGGAGSVYDSSISTVLQTIVHRDMRGRVVGLYTATWGSNQLGSFGLGILATIFGAPTAIASFAAVVALSAIRLFPKRAMIDPRLVSLDDRAVASVAPEPAVERI